jgi:hypothetical protein
MDVKKSVKSLRKKPENGTSLYISFELLIIIAFSRTGR